MVGVMTDVFMLPPSGVSGELQFFWITSSGDIHNLTKSVSPSLWVMAGSAGLGDAEFEVSSLKLPSGAGSLIERINTMERTISLPVIAHGDDIGELLLLAQDLHDWFDTGDETEKRPGILRVI